jgi:hypothetical protein
MPVFYVLHVQEKPLGDCIDAIRFLCNPSEKQRAHITVRGPYQKKIDIEGINRRLVGGIVSIDGVGNFFDSQQNTVFFRCSAPKLKAVWRKPDFPFSPHITIYDGGSAEFAHRLYDLLNRYDYSLRFRADELEAIESTKGQKSLQLALAFNSSFVRKIVGERITADVVPILPEQQRLGFVAQLCKHLSASPKARAGGPSLQSALQFPKHTSLPS